MKYLFSRGALSAAFLTAFSLGCNIGSPRDVHELGDFRPTPLGTISDPIWQQQERNAEASDFVIHEHEFTGNSAILNAAGESHLKSIAARMSCVSFPVLIEPSSMSPKPGTRYGYAVHNDPKLDQARRTMIVHLLTNMGQQDAESRVVVAPALTPGFESFEAQGAFGKGFGNNGRGGMGAGFGGMGAGRGGF